MRFLAVVIVFLTINLFPVETLSYLKINTKQINDLNDDKSSGKSLQMRAKKLEPPLPNSRIFYMKIAPPASYTSAPSISSLSSSLRSPSYHASQSSYSYSHSDPSSTSISLSSSQSSSSSSLSNSKPSSSFVSSSSSISKNSDRFKSSSSFQDSVADRRSDSKRQFLNSYRNSNLYTLPIKFVSNARPFHIKGLWAKLVPRADGPVKKRINPKNSKNPKNSYRYLTEMKKREGDSKVHRLQTKFVSNGKPFGPVLIGDSRASSSSLPSSSSSSLSSSSSSSSSSLQSSAYSSSSSPSFPKRKLNKFINSRSDDQMYPENFRNHFESKGRSWDMDMKPRLNLGTKGGFFKPWFTGRKGRQLTDYDNNYNYDYDYFGSRFLSPARRLRFGRRSF